MSFSATWGNQHDVCKPDVTEDLALENAALSPPLAEMADDVKAMVEKCAAVAAELVAALPDSPTGKFYVSAGGHVRQPDDGIASNVSISISENQTTA